jgi:hypothetical protein
VSRAAHVDAIATWARHEESLVSLRRALEILDAASVPALVVKGMVLAYTLYDDVAHRPMSDVDLRVRPRDYVRATRAMRAAGFRADWMSRRLGSIGFRVGRVTVELESTVGPPGMCALRIAEMMTRSRERVLSGGLRVREPELHDHAALLVVNAFKDKLVDAMPWALGDLELIAARIDAGVFVERVRAARLRTIAWIVADWMATERGSERWRELRDRLGARPPRPLYARTLRALVARGPSGVLTPALARVGSDSLPLRAWALAATGLGLGVSALGRWRQG